MSTNHPDPSQSADPRSRSHLFTVRVWYEEADPGRREVRLQVRHILTGETRNFRDWPAFITYLTGIFDTPNEDLP